mgnify:CR=1 FL=1
MNRFNLRSDVRGQGRSLAQIADAYGAPLPTAFRAVAAASRHTEADLVHSAGSSRGFMGRARGWSPVPHPLVVDRASTADVGGGLAGTFGARSQHLAVLRNAGFVQAGRGGNRRLYRADRARLGSLAPLLEAMWADTLDRLAEAVEADEDGRGHP